MPIPPDNVAPGDSGHIAAHNNIADELTALAGGAVALAGDLTGTAGAAQVTGTHLASPLPVAQGGTASASRVWAGLLTPAAVQPSAYSAAAGDLVPVDTTNGNVTVTLPNAPADLTVVAVKHVIQGGTNTVGIVRNPAGADVFNKAGGGTSVTLTLLNQGAVLQYKAGSPGIWYVIADDLALSQLDARYPQLGNVAPNTATGAKFDGITDDHAALINDQTANRTLYLPGGTASISATMTLPGATVRGAGMYSTTIRASAAMTMLLYGASYVPQVEISDLTLDGNNLATLGLGSYGNRIGRLIVRRCRFINFPGVIIQAGYAANYVIEDCVAEGGGLAVASFFYATASPFESLTIRRNRLAYMYAGITIGSSGFHAANVQITDNDIDGGWYLLASAYANSGGTVTYTATTVTDTAAAFGSIPATSPSQRYVRALSPRQSSTFTTTAGTYVTDTAAAYITNGVKRGEIIRSGTAFAVVASVISNTALHVEEWLDQTTYQPATPPAAAASYIVYAVYLGCVASNTSTVITVTHGAGGGGGGWFDLAGASVTPSAGTLYEVLSASGGYPVFCTPQTEKLIVSRNRVRRGRYDNLELFGNQMIVTDNICEDGQDMGLVIQGTSTSVPCNLSVIEGNLCSHNGSGGLDVANAANIEIGPNQFFNNCWTTPSTNNIGQFRISASVNVTATGGHATNTGESSPSCGLVITGSSTSGIAVSGFAGSGHTLGDIYIATSVPAAACDLLDVTGVITYQATTNGQRLRVKGTGTPALIASPGSQFLSVSGAGAGTTLYIKEAGNDSTGWDVIGATPNLTPSVQMVTATGSYTWTKPSGALIVDVILCGAGGGGASGAIAITGNAGGGGGGGGGALTIRSFVAADLPGSVTGSVGTGGAGGTAASGTTAASGSNGSSAGSTTFGAYAFAGGGNVGAQGTTSGGAGGGALDSGTSRGGTGGAGGTGIAGVASAPWGAATGGGGGGGATTAAGFNGGVGQFNGMGGTGNTGTAGIVGGASPGTGIQPAVKGTPSCGGGGGAGATGATPTAQAGATAFFGGGGGGGGAAFMTGSTTGTSGAGGKGGDGFALIVTHFA